MADLNYTMLNPVRKVHMPARIVDDVDTHSLGAQCCKEHTRYTPRSRTTMSLALLTCKRLQAIGVPELRQDPDAFIEDESDDDDGSFNLIKMLFKGSEEVSLHMSLAARQLVCTSDCVSVHAWLRVTPWNMSIDTDAPIR